MIRRIWSNYLDACYLIYLMIAGNKIVDQIDAVITVALIDHYPSYLVWTNKGDYKSVEYGSASDLLGLCPFCGAHVSQPGCDRRDINWAPMHVRTKE